MKSAFLLALLLLGCLAAPVFGYLPEQVEDDDVMPEITVPYRVQSQFVEMRDGVQLWTTYYTPLLGRTHGTIVQRTPYTTIRIVRLAAEWLSQGFAVLMQDQRGSGISRGDTFQYWRTDGADGKDTMDWIVSQSWSNGNVFFVGPSADGNAVIASLLESPTHLRAFAPAVATGDGHTTTFQGGAFRQSLVRSWLTVLGFRDTLEEVRKNEAFSDWWDTITLPGKENLCTIPGVFNAGWFDIFGNENIDGFNACQYVTNSPVARGKQKIVVNPGGHCLRGEYSWPNARISLPTNLKHALFLTENGDDVPSDLEDKIEDALAITYYVMGPEDGLGNYWTTTAQWPDTVTTPYYLHADGTILATPSAAANSSITYTYDPKDPVGTIGGPELFLPCGPRDQTELEDRQDVLVFTLAPFKENVAIVGNVSAVLYVSSDAVDTDFTVKITDVYPDGRSMLLVDGIQRMRWRDSKSVPSYMESGVVYEITVNLMKTAYVFNEGHSLRVAISSSNEPRFEKNPNNGLLITETGAEIVAENTVFFDRGHPSRVILPIVDLADVAENYFP